MTENTPAYKEYVCGFLFNEDARQNNAGLVALILKKKPKWQEGKYNGIGGHIESTDLDPQHAMAREFKEEAGLDISPAHWEQFARIEGEGYTCYFFRAFSNEVLWVTTAAPEEGAVTTHGIHAIPDNTLTNVKWLIQMAINEVPGHGMPFRIREGSTLHKKG